MYRLLTLRPICSALWLSAHVHVSWMRFCHHNTVKSIWDRTDKPIIMLYQLHFSPFSTMLWSGGKRWEVWSAILMSLKIIMPFFHLEEFKLWRRSQWIVTKDECKMMKLMRRKLHTTHLVAVQASQTWTTYVQTQPWKRKEAQMILGNLALAKTLQTLRVVKAVMYNKH